MSFKKIFAVLLIAFSFCVHAQEVFNLRVDSFEAVLKKFQDKDHQPEHKCDEFVKRKYQLNALSLYAGAAHCYRQSSWLDSATLLSMADIKFQFDQTRYPVDDLDKVALSNVVAIRSLAFSHYGNEYIYEGENDTVASISRSIREWNIDVSGKISPGWQHLKESLSSKDLKDIWTHLKGSKIATLESAGYFLKNHELGRARKNWLATIRNIENADRQKSQNAANGEIFGLVRKALKEQEAEQLKIYTEFIDKLDDEKRPYIKNFKGRINVSDLMKINPVTLNPIDEVQGFITSSQSGPDMRSFKITLGPYQHPMLGPDMIHFLSLCVGDLIARTQQGVLGWQIGTDQVGLDKLEFTVKFLRSEEKPLQPDKLKFLDAVWMKDKKMDESCNFIRHGYFS